MKSAEEVRPYIVRLYREQLGGDEKDLIEVKTREMAYHVYRKDGESVEISRKFVDDYIDNQDGSNAGEVIVALLRPLKERV